MKIGFITCHPSSLKSFFPTMAEPDLIQTNPYFTPDDQIVVNELQQHGYHVVPIQWGCESNTLKDFHLVIVRSPWDYMDSEVNKEKFMQWVKSLEKSGIPVANPPSFMQWMLDKHYLRDIAYEGCHVIPTTYYQKNSTLNLLEIFRNKGEFILKPCISAAGIGLFHIKSIDDAIQFQYEINERIINNSYMLQDFIPEIIENGEWSLVFIGGKYSHAVHKKPGLDSILVHAERGGSLNFLNQPRASLIDFAIETYQKIFPAFKKATGSLCNENFILYLRLDVIETEVGPVLIECEGVEPELFFRANPASKTMFIHAIQSLLKVV